VTGDDRTGSFAVCHIVAALSRNDGETLAKCWRMGRIMNQGGIMGDRKPRVLFGKRKRVFRVFRPPTSSSGRCHVRMVAMASSCT
jgi:hypothetical protein